MGTGLRRSGQPVLSIKDDPGSVGGDWDERAYSLPSQLFPRLGCLLSSVEHVERERGCDETILRAMHRIRSAHRPGNNTRAHLAGRRRAVRWFFPTPVDPDPIFTASRCVCLCVPVWCELSTSHDRAKPVESILIPPEGINPVQQPPQPCFVRPAGRWEVGIGQLGALPYSAGGWGAKRVNESRAWLVGVWESRGETRGVA
jgi:hypothetical protein